MRFPSRISGLILSLFTLSAVLAAPLPLSGITSSLSSAQVVHFVETNLPARIGTVSNVGSSSASVSKPPEVQVNQQTPVRVVRRETDPDGETVSTRQIGRGRFVPVTQTRGRLEASASVIGRVQNGDELWLPPVQLYLKNSTPLNSEQLSNRLGNLPSIGRVSLRVPETFPDSSRLQIVLEINNRGAFLRKAGDWAAFATLVPSQTSNPEMRSSSRQATQAPGGRYSLEEAFEVSGHVLSFDWVSLGPNNSVNIIAMGKGNRIGFARWTGELDGLTWHDLDFGRALDISLLPKKMRNPRNLPFIVVTHQQRDIVSTYYEYDLVNRTLTRRWSERHYWIRAGDGAVYGQQIGLGMPYERRIWPMEVTRNDWNWKGTPSGESPFPHQSVIWGLQVFDGHYFRYNEEGEFEVWQGNSRLAKTSRAHGRTRFKVYARQDDRTPRMMHPRAAIWERGSGYRFLVPSNQESGVASFFQTLTLDEGNVQLFDLTGSQLRKLWSSRTVAGYVSQVGRGPEAPWLTAVLSEENATRFFRVKGTGFPGKR